MHDKVVLITGASRGIGAATARLAAARGYRVVVNYVRNADAADAVVAEVERQGSEAIAMQADFRLKEKYKTCFAKSTIALAVSMLSSTMPGSSTGSCGLRR